MCRLRLRRQGQRQNMYHMHGTGDLDRAGEPGPGDAPGQDRLTGSGQGWTGPLGPRSRRIDCMIANVVVLVKISMSAPPSTPVYFAMTGAAACSVTASRWALTAAHTFSP